MLTLPNTSVEILENENKNFSRSFGNFINIFNESLSFHAPIQRISKQRKKNAMKILDKERYPNINVQNRLYRKYCRTKSPNAKNYRYNSCSSCVHPILFCSSFYSLFCFLPLFPLNFIDGVVLVKKAQAKVWKFFFPTFKFVTIRFFLLENPSHWGLETVVCPIFAEPFLDVFSVCLLVPRTNLSDSQQQSYVIKISYLIKADLRLLLSYTDWWSQQKSQYSLLFMLQTNV